MIQDMFKQFIESNTQEIIIPSEKIITAIYELPLIELVKWGSLGVDKT